MKTETVQKHIDEITAMCRLWQQHNSKQDHESYCENASRESVESQKVVKAFRELSDVLTNYERHA